MASQVCRTSVLPQTKPWRRGNSFAPSIWITGGWRRPKAAGTQKRSTCFAGASFFGYLGNLKCSGQVNCPCAKVLPAAKRLYGAKAPPRCAGPRSCPASILCGQDKTKGHPKGCPFVLGSDRQRRSPPFGISMLGVGKAAPAPRFSPAVKTLVRRTRAAGQKAGWVQFCPLAENLKIFRL